MDPYALLRQAILDRQVLLVTYDGHQRLVCPHVLGTKNGEAHALVYQLVGGSERGLGPAGHTGNWRCLLVSKIENIEPGEGTWHTAENYSPAEQTCVDVIDAQV